MARLHLVLRTLFLLTIGAYSLPQPCPSEIYCHGPLLHTVQMAELYRDSKTFVDKKLRYDPQVVLGNFSVLMNSSNNSPSNEQLSAFIDEHFDAEGSEFEPWYPTDWISDPVFLQTISDPVLRDWATQLNEAWKQLGRQIKGDVRDNPELYSMIYVPNPFIVPGGRFREFYYWDSYWIVQGLLLSQMTQTVKGMLSNFALMVDKYGLIPNGGRIYYQQRSQPPMLIPMVDRYVNATGDLDFLRNNIHLLEKELQFWLLNRTVEVDGHTLARYNVEYDGPRPESYREDYSLAGDYSGADLEEFYMHIKSGAESGWDFSTRWFISEDGSNAGDMRQLKTRNIIPVDLNSFVCMSTRLLSEMYLKLGDPVKAQTYNSKYLEWKSAIHNVLWDDEEGVWLDYDLINAKKRPYFYASNIAPLWAGCWDPVSPQNSSVVDKVLHYLDQSQTMTFVGGLPTSLQNSGQQWDYPNGWPPLEHLMVVGLENTGDARAQALAYDLARKWLNNNLVAFQQSMPNAMFEKYDVTVVGLPGGGGEYDVQLGFGWTNGVVLDFLNMYGKRLKL